MFFQISKVQFAVFSLIFFINSLIQTSFWLGTLCSISTSYPQAGKLPYLSFGSYLSSLVVDWVHKIISSSFENHNV